MPSLFFVKYTAMMPPMMPPTIVRPESTTAALGLATMSRAFAIQIGTFAPMMPPTSAATATYTPLLPTSRLRVL